MNYESETFPYVYSNWHTYLIKQAISDSQATKFQGKSGQKAACSYAAMHYYYYYGWPPPYLPKLPVIAMADSEHGLT